MIHEVWSRAGMAVGGGKTTGIPGEGVVVTAAGR